MWRDAWRLDEPSEFGERYPTRRLAEEGPKMYSENAKIGPRGRFSFYEDSLIF